MYYYNSLSIVYIYILHGVWHGKGLTREIKMMFDESCNSQAIDQDSHHLSIKIKLAEKSVGFFLKKNTINNDRNLIPRKVY